MSHTIRDKKKLLNRVRRLRGQIEAVERALDEEGDCASVLHLIATCRGAIGSLMSEVIEGHINLHIVAPGARSQSQRTEAAQQLIEVLKTYLK